MKNEQIPFRFLLFVDAGDVVDPLAAAQAVEADGGLDDIFDHQAEAEDLVRHLEHKA